MLIQRSAPTQQPLEALWGQISSCALLYERTTREHDALLRSQLSLDRVLDIMDEMDIGPEATRGVVRWVSNLADALTRWRTFTTRNGAMWQPPPLTIEMR